MTPTPPVPDHEPPLAAPAAWADDVARELAERRQRMVEFGESLRQRLATLETALAEQVSRVVEDRVAELRAEHDAALAACEARSRELEQQAEELEARRRHTRVQRRRIAGEIQLQRRKLRRQLHEAGAAPRRVAELETERDRVLAELAELRKAGRSTNAASDDSRELAELRRRHENMLADLRETKRRYADLEASAAQGKPPSLADGPLSWEAQKRRMLALLEADADSADAERQDERLTIDGTIRITDTVIADKEREIAELKQLLDAQSKSVGSMAVGAAALGAMLDQDELIVQERERLQQLRTDGEEKQRLAEIELSMERAKIARARAELEDLRRELGADREPPADADPTANIGAEGGKGKKPNRGRWLSRLGLKDENEAG